MFWQSAVVGRQWEVNMFPWKHKTRDVFWWSTIVARQQKVNTFLMDMLASPVLLHGSQQ
jgi:hypothetical protein